MSPRVRERAIMLGLLADEAELIAGRVPTLGYGAAEIESALRQAGMLMLGVHPGVKLSGRTSTGSQVLEVNSDQLYLQQQADRITDDGRHGWKPLLPALALADGRLLYLEYAAVDLTHGGEMLEVLDRLAMTQGGGQ